MKKIIGISIVLSFIMMNAFTQKAETKVEKPTGSTSEVICIHDLQLKPGVNVKEFEIFVMNEIAPLYNQMKGQHLFLAKGDRGIRNGQYSIIITFTNIEDRDRIYPLDIGFSEEFTKIMEGKEKMWEKFNSMAEGFDGMHNTDYVKIVQ